MRNKILSLMIAGLIMAGFLLVNHLMRGENRGQAQASAALHAIDGQEIDIKNHKKDMLRRVSASPDTLLEMNAQHIRSLFDEPGLVRHESPITIWQYRSEACVLDLYFKGKAKDTFKPIVHYEIRARAKGARDEDVRESCAGDLLKSKNGFQMVSVSSFYKSWSE